MSSVFLNATYFYSYSYLIETLLQINSLTFLAIESSLILLLFILIDSNVVDNFMSLQFIMLSNSMVMIIKFQVIHLVISLEQ
jgi:hypothetical protein